MLIRWPQVVAMGNALVLPLITSTVMLRSAEREERVLSAVKGQSFPVLDIAIFKITVI